MIKSRKSKSQKSCKNQNRKSRKLLPEKELSISKKQLHQCHLSMLSLRSIKSQFISQLTMREISLLVMLWRT